MSQQSEKNGGFLQKFPDEEDLKEHRLVFQDGRETSEAAGETTGSLPELSKEEVLEGLVDALQAPSLAPTIERIYERGAEEERELRRLHIHMKQGADRFFTILQSLKGRKPSEDEVKELQHILETARALGTITKKQLELRRELVDALREELAKERSGLGEATAFVDIDRGTRTLPTELGNNIEKLAQMQPADAFAAIKELLAQERPNRDNNWKAHLLFVVYQPKRENGEVITANVDPYFPNITYVQRILAGLPEAIDRAKPADEQEALRAQIENLQRSFETFQIENPIAYHQYLGNEMKPSPLYAKPLRLAALGVATVAGVMSLIPVLRKLWKGENLSASDWPAAAWPVLGGYLSGFLPFKSKGPLEQIVEAGVKVGSDAFRPFRDAVSKMGVESAVAAASNLHDILQEPASVNDDGKSITKKKMLENALETRRITLQFLQEFIGEELKTGIPIKSPLLAALSKDTLNDGERREYLDKLTRDLQIHKASRRDAAIAAIRAIHS